MTYIRNGLGAFFQLGEFCNFESFGSCAAALEGEILRENMYSRWSQRFVVPIAIALFSFF